MPADLAVFSAAGNLAIVIQTVHKSRSSPLTPSKKSNARNNL